MDGVLLRSMHLHYQAWQEAAQSLDVTIDRTDIYRREGEPGFSTVRDLAPPAKRRLLLARKERNFRRLKHRIRPYPHAERLLRWLQQRGLPLGLVTGTARSEIRIALPVAMARCFDAIVSGDEVRRGKPHPEGYRKACCLLGVRPSRMMVIENAPYGIRAARAARVGYVVGLSTTMPAELLCRSDRVFSSLYALRTWLERQL
jgi:beta-phosphoglucomutase